LRKQKGGEIKMIDYTNKNLRPKTFFVTMERNRDGSFTVKRAKVLNRTNQYQRSIKRVDARDITRAIKTNDINVA
jgi:hypothetical protein